MQLLAILSVASLFGGMLLFDGGFGTLAFNLSDKGRAHSLIGDPFPYFYIYFLVNSGVAAVLYLATNKSAFLLIAIIFIITIPNRKILMPAINYAAHTGNKKTGECYMVCLY